MGNLFTSLLNSAGSMRVFERSLNVIQNNVANASTPGYAEQELTLIAMPFQPALGLAGGVDAGDIFSARSSYAEDAVRQQQQGYGKFSQKAADLAKLEPVFSITEKSGIPGAISSFFQAVSSLAVAPNDSAARQVVIDRAADLARSFNQTGTSLVTAQQGAGRELRSVVDRINSLGATIREINVQRRENFEANKDAGLDAQLHTALEDLSELVNFTTLNQPDGSVTVLLGRQTPLVMGDKLHPLQVDLASTTPKVLSDSGKDVTGQFSEGRIGSLIDVTTRLLPAYTMDLNTLAASVADTVNATLKAGVDSTGSTPTVDLFSYDPANPATTIAATALTPGQFAAALPGAPGGNGNALRLAALSGAKTLNGYTSTEFYGKLAGRVGRELADARSNESVQQLLVAQARSSRADISSVSLDEEAARLVEFQRSYQAAAKMFSVLDEMTPVSDRPDQIGARMVQRLDPSSEAFLAALQRVSQRAERATRQIATGYRVTAPSDRSRPDQQFASGSCRARSNHADPVKSGPHPDRS